MSQQDSLSQKHKMIIGLGGLVVAVLWLLRSYWFPVFDASSPDALDVKDPPKEAYANPRQWTATELVAAYSVDDLDATLAWCSANGVSAYDYGLHLHLSGHTKNGMRWFTVMGQRTNDASYLYGLAWLRMDIGEFQEARRDANVVLQSRPSQLIRARTHYLLGTIFRKELDLKKASDHLLDGIKDYGELNKPGGQALCNLELAKVFLAESDYPAVEKHIKEAEALDRKSVELGYRSNGIGKFLEVRAEMALKRHDFQSALSLFRQTEQVFVQANSFANAAKVEPKIALALFLVGEPEAALNKCRDIWDRYESDITKTEVLAWNALVMMKISLCAQHYAEARKDELFVRNWVGMSSGEKQVLELLEVLKDDQKSPCPEWR